MAYVAPPVSSVRVVFDTPTPQTFEVEVAASAPALIRGLSGRRLAEDLGLLMVFPQESTWAIWMRGMLVPIDIIFMDDRRRVVKIVHAAKPGLEKTHEARARFVLEVSAGSARRKGLTLGQTARFESMSPSP